MQSWGLKNLNINRLKQYRAIQREIKKIESDIERLKEKPNKYKFGIDTVMSSSPKLPYAKRPIAIVGYGYDSTGDSRKYELIKNLIEQKLKLEKEFWEIKTFIDTVEDSEMRQILRHRYVDGFSWQKVAFEIEKHDEQYPRKKHKNFFENL